MIGESMRIYMCAPIRERMGGVLFQRIYSVIESAAKK